MIYNSLIPFVCEIGSGTEFVYKGVVVVIHYNVVIGRSCVIAQHLATDERSGIYNILIIGDNVYLDAVCKVLGDVYIGNNAVIGANAVVNHDVTENAIAIGVQQLLRKIKKEVN